MPSGSKKEDYADPEQYEKQLAHSRAWKQRNRDRVKRYNRAYNLRKRQNDGPKQSSR